MTKGSRLIRISIFKLSVVNTISNCYLHRTHIGTVVPRSTFVYTESPSISLRIVWVGQSRPVVGARFLS